MCEKTYVADDKIAYLYLSWCASQWLCPYLILSVFTSYSTSLFIRTWFWRIAFVPYNGSWLLCQFEKHVAISWQTIWRLNSFWFWQSASIMAIFMNTQWYMIHLYIVSFTIASQNVKLEPFIVNVPVLWVAYCNVL